MRNIVFKRFGRNFIFLILVLMLFGCGDKKEIYTNRAFDIKFQYPPDWDKKEYYGETIATFLFPKQSKTDLFTKNVNFTVQDIGYLTNLDTYTEAVADTIKKMGELPEVHQRMIRDGYRNIGGRQGYEVVYTLTRYGIPEEIVKELSESKELAEAGIAKELIDNRVDTEGQTFQILQAWTIYDGRAYIFTYLAPGDKFDTSFESVEALIKSIRFI
ncbi:MAG: hypothetical protein P9M07_07795 [Candidatus Aceula meridiana]|nr:hypothetical protein [Candidatus Aceula meridiana]